MGAGLAAFGTMGYAFASMITLDALSVRALVGLGSSLVSYS
jgi:hypothetical protein